MKKLSVGLIKKAIKDLSKEEYYNKEYEEELEAPFRWLKVRASDGTLRIELKSGYNSFSMDFSVYSSGELYYHLRQIPRCILLRGKGSRTI